MLSMHYLLTIAVKNLTHLDPIASGLPSLNALVQAVMLSSQDLVYFSLILCIFMFIYAVLGKQIFKGIFPCSRLAKV